MILFWLVFAHCMGDMAFQTQFIADRKGKNFFFMMLHAIIWTGSINIVLEIFNIFSPWKFLLLIIPHMIIDFWKANLPRDDKHMWAIYVDQSLHFLQLVAVWLL
jgi:hypothetical protein